MGSLVDLEKLGAHFDYDEALFKALVVTFGQIYNGQIDDLKSCISKKDYNDFERIAHSIKGGVANFYADQARDKAYSLEQIGSSAQFPDDLEKSVDELHELLKQVEASLKKIDILSLKP